MYFYSHKDVRKFQYGAITKVILNPKVKVDKQLITINIVAQIL